jgi:hypothetical protein
MAENIVTQEAAIQLLYEIIATGKRHALYDRCCELSQEYKAYSLGEGIDEKLHRFTATETEEAFELRKEITVNICKSIVNGSMSVFNRVPRTEAVKVEWQTKNDVEFQKVLDYFGRYGFDQYLANRLPKLCEIDPNSFIVYEFNGTDGKKLAQPYPYEVYSENAIDYEYKNADLLYLVDWQCVEVPDELKEQTDKEILNKYTIYTAEGACTYIEQAINKEGITNVFDNESLVNIGENTYQLLIPQPYNLEQTPATQVGYLTDDENNGKCFVNQYHYGIPFLEKILKTNSELDITMARHAHMQKIQYVRKCTADGCSIDTDGVYKVDGHCCSTCDGTGIIDVTRGGLEFIYLPLPDSPQDIVSLDNIVKYIQIPVEIANLQRDYIKEMTDYFRKAIFNTDIFTRSEIADTATAKILETENLYDTLYLYAVNYAMVKEEGLYIISDIIDREIDVIAKVGKDFKLLNKTELLAMLQTAQTAGANDEVIGLINKELVRAMGGDEVLYDLQRRLIPFAGKTKEMVMLTLSQLKTNDRMRLKYLLGADILKDLVDNYPLFLEISYKRKRELFEQEIDKFVEIYKPIATNPYLVDTENAE